MKSSTKPILDVVCVNHGTSALVVQNLVPLLAPLRERGGQVTVVDTGGRPEELERLRASLPRDVSFVVLGADQGFGAACNRGAQHGRGRWLLFLNPDTRLRPQMLERLRHWLDAQDGAGAAVLGGVSPVGPRASGPRCDAPPIPPGVDANQAGLAVEVEWVAGSFMAVRRSVFLELGGFDERFFLYFEDVDLCRRARQQGYSVRVLPWLHHEHPGHASFHLTGRDRAACYRESRVKYLRKHHGRVAAWLYFAGVQLREAFFERSRSGFAACSAALLAGMLILLLGLFPGSETSLARGRPVNTAKDVSQVGRDLFVPRRTRAMRIPVYRNVDAIAWVQGIFSRVGVAAGMLTSSEARTLRQKADRLQKGEVELEDVFPEMMEQRRGGRRKGHDEGPSLVILEWDLVNAFATSGKRMFVTTGLLESVESDDELAAVLGHEIAHVQRGHIGARARRQMVSSLLFALATARRGGEAFLAGQALSALPVMPFGQEQELDADRVSAGYLKKAGYDPRGMVSFLEKLGRLDKGPSSGGVASLFQTHPSAPRRVEEARRVLERLGIYDGVPGTLGYDMRRGRRGAPSFDHGEGVMLLTTATLPPVSRSGRTVTRIDLPGNAILHGGFEGDFPGEGLPPGWVADAGEVSVDVEQAHGGERSLRLRRVGDEKWAEATGPAIPIEPGQDYLLSGYLRSTDGRQRMYLGLRYLDEQGSVLATEYPAAWGIFVPSVWTRYQSIVFSRGGKYSIPEKARSFQVVVAGSYLNDEPSWADDLVLLRVAP